MPGILSAGRRQEVTLVAHAAGVHRFSDASEPLGSGYMWLTADRTLIVALNGEDGNAYRTTFDVDHAVLRGKSGRFTLMDGRHIDTSIRECGCGMGAAGSFPLMDVPHRIRMVNEMPDWVDVA